MAGLDSEPDSTQVDLESKLTFLERAVEQLSEVMHEQGARLEQVDRRLSVLLSRLERAGGGSEEIHPHSDPPPHY